MIVEYIIVIVFYYLFYRITIGFLFPKDTYVTKFYNIVFFLGLIFVVLLHFSFVELIKNQTNPILYGIYWDDDRIYHTQGIELAKRSLTWDSSFHGDWAFLWQYFVGINYYVFGVNSLFPKIGNIGFLAIGIISLVLISKKVFSNSTLMWKSLFLLIGYLPLIFYTASLSKELLLFSLISYTLYIYIVKPFKNDFLNYTIIGFLIILILLTRHQFALILMTLIVLFSFIESKQNSFFRILGVALVAIVFLGVYNSDVFQALSIRDQIENNLYNKTLFIDRANAEYIYVEGSYVDIIPAFFNNPLQFTNRLLLGYFSLFFSPPPTSIPGSVEMIKTVPQHFFISLYSPIWYLLLPALFMGLIYKRRLFKFTSIDYFLISFFIFTYSVIVLTKGDFYRYRLSFTPILFIYISFGVATFQRWKDYLPLIILILLLLLFIANKYISGVLR